MRGGERLLRFRFKSLAQLSRAPAKSAATGSDAGAQARGKRYAVVSKKASHRGTRRARSISVAAVRDAATSRRGLTGPLDPGRLPAEREGPVTLTKRYLRIVKLSCLGAERCPAVLVAVITSV